MSSSLLTEILPVLQFLIWPILSLFMVAAAVLLVKAEPRSHTIAFLIGAVIVFLQGVAQFMIFAPGFGLMHQQDWGANDHRNFAFLSSGVSFVGHGLMAFGLLSFAIVHLRRTRMEKVLD